MSLRSESHVGGCHCFGLGTSGRGAKRPKTANETSGYIGVLKRHQAARESLDPIDPEARNATWISPELSVFSNNEYVFATFPIALALFWDNGGKEICESRSLTVIFTILSHCLSATAANNYSLRTLGKCLAKTRFKKGLRRSHRSAIFSKIPEGLNWKETSPKRSIALSLR